MHYYPRILEATVGKTGWTIPLYTGWELDNPKATNEYDGYYLHPKRASLDRIRLGNGLCTWKRTVCIGNS